MPTTTVARFEGSEQVLANLRAMTNRVRNKGRKKALMAAGLIVRDEASLRAPVDTGRLSRKMVLEWDGRRRVAKVGPHKDTYYGDLVERGTSKSAAQPFLRPALEAKRDDAFRAMARELLPVVEATR